MKETMSASEMTPVSPAHGKKERERRCAENRPENDDAPAEPVRQRSAGERAQRAHQKNAEERVLRSFHTQPKGIDQIEGEEVLQRRDVGPL